MFDGKKRGYLTLASKLCIGLKINAANLKYIYRIAFFDLDSFEEFKALQNLLCNHPRTIHNFIFTDLPHKK